LEIVASVVRTTDPEMIATVRSLSDGSLPYFEWDGGSCRSVTVSNYSHFRPKS